MADSGESQESLMRLAKITLLLTAAGFLLFGTLFLINPRMLEKTGAALLTPTSRFEVRAFYGGFELGLGVFFLLASMRPAWFRVALTAQVVGFAGLVGGRLVAYFIDGAPSADMFLF